MSRLAEERACLECGELFRPFAFMVNRGQGKCCSNSCSSIQKHKAGLLRGTGFQPGIAHPRWKRGSFIHNGYVEVAPSLRTGKSSKQHRQIAERALGKPLDSKYPVHHHNEDRADNANRNLVICESGGYHKLIHARMRILKAGGDPDKQKFCYKCRGLFFFESFTIDRSKPHCAGTICKGCQKQRRDESRKSERTSHETIVY